VEFKKDFPHLIEALDRVTRKLGGLTRRWRFDRMATVYSRSSDGVSAAFAQVAKHYAVAVDLCPPRHGNRKGVVEKANHSAAQRWWRTVADDATVAAAQRSLDELCERLDGRTRRRDGQKVTVGELAAAELAVVRTVSAQALVSFRGNRYSVPPGMPGAQVVVRHRLGDDQLRIVTAAGVTVAVHRRAPTGAGAVVRDEGHVRALEARVLQAFSDAPPCRRKTRRPAGDASRAEAARLRGAAANSTASSAASTAERVVIDMAAYAALVPAAARETASTPVRGESR
jgi:hypothetical protein